MAFAIAGRSSEVSALTVAGIRRVAEGLEVHVPSVKGRPARDVAVHHGANPLTCPVRCWLAWQAAADLVDGPAFRAVDQVGRVGAGPLSPDGCRIAITRAAERAGLDVKLTGHSARRGLITTGRKRGKKPEKLRKQSGHAANSPVFWSYVEEGEMWEDAATEDIGL
ncbi:integrase [Embleya hyalina]|uniref:Integrase n=1 Tax=Embleya hyalina TaxID=516124 RepID=A0A401Z3W2_9ACTN|nr:integrase [Embleya hyalina]